MNTPSKFTRNGPTPPAMESAKVLLAGVVKGDIDSIEAALTVPLDAFPVESHREVIRALREVRGRGLQTPETADLLGEVDPMICPASTISALSDAPTSINPSARAATLREDAARREWERKAGSFGHRLPSLSPDVARIEFDELLNSLDTNADGWPRPEPLPKSALPVEPFTPELLPNAFRGFVIDAAERMQCPVDYTAVAIMVAAGSLLGRRCGIRPKRHDDWIVVPNLWGAVIGDPSVKKTPAMQPVMNLLNCLDTKARKEFEAAMQEYNRATEVHTHRLRAAKKAATKVAEHGGNDDAICAALEVGKCNHPLPIRRRYFTNDTTVEKLGELLRDNTNGILVFRDELTGWLRMLDRDGHECDRPFYLEAWNGTGRFTYDRIGRGTIEIEAACLSILGGIQPGPLTQYFRSAFDNGAAADGLIQRFQLLVWPDIPGEWRNVDREPDFASRDAALEVFERLADLDAPQLGAEPDTLGRVPFLRLAANAQDGFDCWRAGLNTRLRTDDYSEPLSAHLGKYESLVAALALVIHLADTPSGGPISLEALERALGWAKYLETHARRVYGTCARGDLDAARALLRHIVGGDLPSPFTAKNVYRNHWAGLSRREDVEAALAVLDDYGWVRGRKVDTGGRPTVHYSHHPSLRKAG